VNLYSFVENPFTDKASFNYEKFKDVAYKAQRLMDDIVDLEEEKINLILKKIENDPEPEEIKAIEKNLWIKIKEKLLQGRRTGLSAIGLADTFAALNLVYGEDSSINLAEEIYKQFAIYAYKSSIDMAKERDAFPIYDHMKEIKNPFIYRMYKAIWPNTSIDYELLYGLGFHRRNIACLTIPPSGTISLLAGISSGIEPVYQLYYKRRRKLEKGNPKITFVDQNGDGWEEYVVYHPKFKEWYYSNPVTRKLIIEHPDNIKYLDGIIDSSENPYRKATSYEIDPIQRVKLQSKIQLWIDHSISSTINLPESVTEEEVSNIYMQAWKEGCKGITIYRDNCRTGVLVSIDKQTDKEEFKQHHAPKRPKILKADVTLTKIKGELYTVFVGLLNNKPYEVFAVYGDWYDKTILEPTLTKLSKGNYLYGARPIKGLMTDEEQVITRLISTSLRHGAEIKFIVEQLNKTEGDLTSFSKAIARVLKHYITDNEETKDLCPDCGSKMIYKDGCKECSNCSYSKCG
jgi:ribonucleoside-diphosphate reductase alpha chain